MIVAGEASGDGHGARLVSALRSSAPDHDFEFFGAAGQAMRDTGVEAIVRADQLAVVGVLEIVRSLRTFLRAFRDLKKAAASRRPDLIVLIDFPDFNLKLAKSLSRKGHRVVYYISPQLWAWRKYRKSVIRDHVDLLLTILPFEKGWYAEHRITNVKYVGHPLSKEVESSLSKQEFREKHGFEADATLIALLPGSRQKELSTILPIMIEAAARMSAVDAKLQFVVALASTRSEDEAQTAIDSARRRGIRLPANFRVVKDETYNALNAADAAAVTSGTATLEAGIIGTPMAIVYKGSALNYRLLRPLIEVDHFGLINLIAGKRVAAELIQNDLTPETLSTELNRLIEPQTNAQMRDELREASEKLGQGGASRRAAEEILKLLDEEEGPAL
ncbi:MAG: lipid-A-disaccharide synthase [Pyrinomonadaceae bacterium]